MFESSLWSAAFAVLVVVAASATRYWYGRRLIARADDPAFPERLAAGRQRSVMVLAVAAAAMVVVTPGTLGWSLPLLLLCRTIAGFPVRKALYRETWSLPAYLWFFARLIACVFGFWLLLALLPLVADLAGRRAWILALPLAAGLFVWNRYSSEVIQYVLRTTPIADHGLVTRVDAIAAQCVIPPPRFERVDLRGGAVANAVALASVRSPAVLFSSTLLDLLDEDETVAICAHELAHLEHFNTAHERRLHATNNALIVAGAAVAIATPFLESSAWLVVLGWVLLLLAVLVRRTRNRQRHETASDRRAVALTGDAEALVRALTKVYEFARMPRRMDPDLERRATHPSLARRIRDIRSAAGVLPVPLEAGASFTAADGRTVATFEPDHLEWREGEAATHSLRYGYLSELRLRAQRSGPAQLVAVEASGRRWEMALAEADLGRAQQVLDLVDGRLLDPPAASGTSLTLARAAAAVTALLAFPLAHFTLALVATVAALRPSAPMLGGAALAAVASAAMTLRSSGIPETPLPIWIGVLFLALGIVLLLLARSRGDDRDPRRTTLATATLGVLVVFSLVPFLFAGLDAVRLHDVARSNAAPVILLLALAGTMLFRRSRPVRYAASAVVVLAGSLVFVGSTMFLESFARDPFLVRAEPIPMSVVGGGASMGEFSVPFFVSELRLSPDGRHVVIVPATETDDDEATTFRVGTAGGTLVPITAEDVLFVDEDHVLVAQTERDGVTLRQASVDPVVDVWQQHVPGIRGALLSYRADTNRWRLLGRDGDGRIVRVDGVVGAPGIEQTRWPMPDGEGSAIDAIATVGDRALVSEIHFQPTLLQRSRTFWRWAWILEPPRRESRFWTIGAQGRRDLAVTRLGTQCLDRALGDDRLVCSVFDGSDTRFVALDPGTGSTTPIGWLPGRFASYHSAVSGWLSGWCGSLPIALRLSTRQAFRAAPDSLHHVTQVTAADRVAATISVDGDRSLVRLYSLE